MVSWWKGSTFAAAFERDRVNILPFPPNEVLKLRFFQRFLYLIYNIEANTTGTTPEDILFFLRSDQRKVYGFAIQADIFLKAGAEAKRIDKIVQVRNE